MSLFVNADGGLTTAGYAGCIALIVILTAVLYFSQKSKASAHMSAKKIAFSSMCIALAAVTSMIKVYELPFGGSVTLCSMLFAVLPGWIYGLSTGLLCGLIYGILQFVLGPYVMTPVQVLFDYIFAFMILGVSGIFSKKKNGLLTGYIVAVIGRWIMATIAGLVWVSLGSTVWDGWAPLPYSMVYNISYIGLEALFTIIIICIPAVEKALNRIKKQALEN
ncbi:MAG: energy-coupled thiamine transporter ThiT [Eubacteriales bacterium]|nr:energy-coupled thiamine transporter ThiT [Eubacteriales bacterium]